MKPAFQSPHYQDTKNEGGRFIDGEGIETSSPWRPSLVAHDEV